MPPPTKSAIFFNERFVAVRQGAGRHSLKNSLQYVLLAAKKGVSSNDDVGVARGTAFQEVGPGAGFTKPANFRSKKVWGTCATKKVRTTFFLNTTPQFGSLRRASPKT